MDSLEAELSRNIVNHQVKSHYLVNLLIGKITSVIIIENRVKMRVVHSIIGISMREHLVTSYKGEMNMDINMKNKRNRAV